MKKLGYTAGYYWTQSDEVAISERQLFRELCMPDSMDESKYKQITDAEAAEIESEIDAYWKEQEAAMLAERESETKE